MKSLLENILETKRLKKAEKHIAEKVFHHQRITPDEAVYLYKHTDLGILSILADFIRRNKHDNNVYYIKNAHLEPSNICIYRCLFCNFSKTTDGNKNWHMTIRDIEKTIDKLPENINEIHITGSCHPDASLETFIEILKTIRNLRPKIHIKAFSAAELYYVFQKEKIKYSEGIQKLIAAGLNSLPGGGAEIFNEAIRKTICPEKVPTKDWLKIHETAHRYGIFSNATMLYGHIETYENRIEHMHLLRKLQDKTNGFKAFIPLKFKNYNNAMSDIKESNMIEDMRNYAVARIFLDNFPHIKTYWPMLGLEASQLSLWFGVDDFDGTINNSTQIYTSSNNNTEIKSLKVNALRKIIRETGFRPVERNSEYKILKP